MKVFALTILTAAALCGCSRQAAASADTTPAEAAQQAVSAPFSADSAYAYVERQVQFGPRVPGSQAHSSCAEWLAAELRRRGAQVTVQEARLTAFDGTPLPARNIFAQFNPQAADRTLLLAHWDSRPWADEDPDPANHKKPVPAANDGASGVGVLLEIARQLQAVGSQKGIDILLVDAEDYGTEGDEDSWALGTRYFVQNPPVSGYRPARAVLLDMVGGRGTVFTREYFSNQNAPELLNQLWSAAADAGHSDLFLNEYGAGITDDHIELIKAGIPAIDIIGFDPEGGFTPTWHTLSDDMNHISRETLGAAGETVMHWLLNY